MQLLDSVADRKNHGRSCANKLGGSWEREKIQRAVKRYHDDGDSKVIGLRLVAAKAFPPQTNIRQKR